MKVVINSCYGGFSLSPKAMLWLYENGYNGKDFITPVEEYFDMSRPDDHIFSYERSLKEWRSFINHDELFSRVATAFLTVFTPCEKFVISGDRQIPRNNDLLIKCVEELGKEANGSHASLKIVEIPDNVDYTIEEYDGNEWVAETHRTWA